MSADRLVLSPDFDTSLVLESDEDEGRLEFSQSDSLVLELAPIVGSGSGVSGPAIYSFAASHG